jgi:Protein of unknown function (DUF2795)
VTLVIAQPPSSKATAAPATVGAPSTDDGLDRVLDELEYPARKWQVVTTAELAGADNVTLGHLNELPRTVYGSLAHIRYVLALGATPRPPRPPVGPNSPEVDAPHRARVSRGRP